MLTYHDYIGFISRNVLMFWHLKICYMPENTSNRRKLPEPDKEHLWKTLQNDIIFNGKSKTSLRIRSGKDVCFLHFC